MQGKNAKPLLIQPYSFGYAAKNMEPGQTELEVVPMEKNMFLSGEINSDTDTLTHKGVDAHGNPYEVAVNVSMSIKARWMKFGSCLASPQFVRRGERVMIYRIADSDRYYWELLGLDDHLRRKDTYTVLISNYDGDDDVDSLNPENSYVIQASTHTGLITIQTNTSGGEQWSYNLQLNTKEGYFVIEDSDGQQFLLDSSDKLLSLVNSAGGKLEMKGRKMTIEIPDSIDIRTKNLTMLVDALGVVSKTFNVDTSGFVVKAANVAINASNAVIRAATSILGRLTNNGINVGSTHRHPETQIITKTPI